jgi:hypothetical protein
MALKRYFASFVVVAVVVILVIGAEQAFKDHH